MLIPYPEVPEILAGVEFVLVRFHLELLDDCNLQRNALLSLRRPLRSAGREVLGSAAAMLFDPPLATDPPALKRFQKAAPAFVLRPRSEQAGEWCAGDVLELEVLLFGAGTVMLDDFCLIVRSLGERGLSVLGRFELAGVDCYGNDGTWRPLRGGGGRGERMPDLLPVSAWLEGRLALMNPLLEIVTPMLLIAGGRVLRQPKFTQLFPFLLRRVTSMLYYHGDLEPVDDPRPLLEAAARVEAHWLETCWQGGPGADAGNDGPPGGLTGRLQLAGEGLVDVMWVVALATLFGVGRGASYGAGGCRLSEMR